jgi:hypothetical protein
VWWEEGICPYAHYAVPAGEHWSGLVSHHGTEPIIL